MQYIKETTTDWKTDYRVPCHTYIMDGQKCIGYIKEGTTEEIIFSKPSKLFSKTRREFVKVNELRTKV
jgi:hypothetical protein